jgi:hypothetical protein
MELKLGQMDSHPCWVMHATADRVAGSINYPGRLIDCSRVPTGIKVFLWNRYKHCACDNGIYLTQGRWELTQSNISWAVFVASGCRLFGISAAVLLGILPPPIVRTGGGGGGGSGGPGGKGGSADDSNLRMVVVKVDAKLQ